MILLREVQERDLETLERFSQIPGFINLPNDRDLLREKIHKAIQSFGSQPQAVKFDGKYIFTAEDVDAGKVLGTSMIAAEHGSVDSPHFYFEVGNEEKFSETINTGFIHGTLLLKYDTNGPSEIGGLVLDPEFRNSDMHIGRQISFIRFLFLGLNRERFKKKILAELLPPLNKRGQSPLWEAIGRRFTNMDYWEADQLCQKNKEFIFSLFPTGKIYTTFLPAEARNAIGKVGKDTEPVMHMLKKIGFEYKNQVDPFDGGPHLWANVEDILPIKKLVRGRYAAFNSVRSEAAGQSLPVSGLLSRLEQRMGQFRAVTVKAVIVPSGTSGDPVSIQIIGAVGGRPAGSEDGQSEDLQVREALGLSPGDAVAFMPYY